MQTFMADSKYNGVFEIINPTNGASINRFISEDSLGFSKRSNMVLSSTNKIYIIQATSPGPTHLLIFDIATSTFASGYSTNSNINGY